MVKDITLTIITDISHYYMKLKRKSKKMNEIEEIKKKILYSTTKNINSNTSCQ